MGDLTGPQRDSLQKVIGKYQSTFSKDDDDLGFCNNNNNFIDPYT